MDINAGLAFSLFSGGVVAVTVAYWRLSQPRYFYIVRHGETLLNHAHIKQGEDGGLSPTGVAQAQAMGSSFEGIGIKRIFTSPYERARETAQYIAASVAAPVEVVPLLAERRSASNVVGKSVDDPEVRLVTDSTEHAYHADGFRYADEENFEDLRKRAKACLRHLKRHSSSKNLVVTHHVFLKMLLAYMLYRDDITSANYVKLAFFNPADNGGVSMCSYTPLHNPFSRSRGWRVHTYNETAEALKTRGFEARV